MMRYYAIWKQLILNAVAVVLFSRWGATLFLLGKFVRFGLFFSFLLLLVSQTSALAGYSLWEVVLFYMTFQWVDAATQMLFREVYRFRPQVVSGAFDLILVKPVSPLFRALLGGVDVLDFLTLVPFTGLIVYSLMRLPGIHAVNIAVYSGLLINALLLAGAFHIGILALAVLTTEIDHAVMIYRDVTGMGKIPAGVYGEPIHSFITFIIPVSVMMSFPVEALIGTLSIFSLIGACLLSLSFVCGSLLLWRLAIARYTSFAS